MHYKNTLPKEVINSFKQNKKDIYDKKQILLVFDKDNTITPANTIMEWHLSDRLAHITQKYTIAILTARDYEICEKHILAPLNTNKCNKNNIILGCSNGSQIYTFDTTKKTYLLASQLSGNFENFMKNLPLILNILKQEFGDDVIFERRSNTMGTFACISRNSSEKERANFDPTCKRRSHIIHILQENGLIPEGFEVIPGGSTSIDVSLYNKYRGMEHIIDYLNYHHEREKIIFFWDGFRNGNGNDDPVAQVSGISSIEVRNPDETYTLLGTFDNRLTN